MIIYVDVLIFLNIIIDYMLLSFCSVMIATKPSLKRIVIGSIFGGIASVKIFLPKLNFLLEELLSLLIAITMIMITYGKMPKLKTLKAVLTLYFSSFLLAGVMLMVSRVFKLSNIAINNSVIYLNFSPVLLIISAALFYILFFILFKIFKSKADVSEICDVELHYRQIKINEKGIIDSGNSCVDYFSNSQIIFSDTYIFDTLISDDKCDNRFRAIPCATVTGTQLLNGIRIDEAIIKLKNKQIILKKPIIVKSETELPEEYKLILNPQILT